MNLPQPGKDLRPLRQIERCDQPIAFQPLIHTELVANVLALHHQELRVELFLQFALPLEGEVGRADDHIRAVPGMIGSCSERKLAPRWPTR
jgi:hypothetical protein